MLTNQEVKKIVEELCGSVLCSPVCSSFLLRFMVYCP